jgi:23S rRNA (adenine2503-C2)-methyltransferase
LRIDDIRHRLRQLGAGPLHEWRVLRLWAMALPQSSGKRRPEDFLPASVRAGLPALIDELDALARLRSEHPAADGSARLLVTLADGQAVESVLLPRDGVCISSQLGCAVGCVFCMTGRSGLLRQLGSAEMVAQVVLARRLRPVKKVVFMGMGEPAHNLDNVMEAIELLGTAGGIGHKNLVLSTVGDERVFERLQALPTGAVRPALALSLHTTKPALRGELLPRAPVVDIAQMTQAAEAYARRTGYPTQYQWTLLDGINDGPDEVDGIVRLLAGHRAIMNLIPWNAVPGLGLDLRRPAPGRAEAFAAELHRRGVLATLRQSAGQEVDGGCGQLRARAVSEDAVSPVVLQRRPVRRAPITTPGTPAATAWPAAAPAALS